MDFDALKLIEDDAKRTNALYDIFNEESRLHSKAARVEFLTTVSFVEKYLKDGAKIADIGAGAGEYSIYFAGLGYHVTAVELADANVAAFRRKLTPELDIDLQQGNACDLSAFDDASFDVVLLLGPLYHILEPADRQKTIVEARRICKPDGIIFFAYISNDMVILTESFAYSKGEYLKNGNYDRVSFAVENFPFVFFTLEAARDELLQNGVSMRHEVAVDGVSELLADKINQLDDETYEAYLRYHLYCCEKPEMLGRSNHLLFIGR